jgi:hypothetical protein
MRLQGVHDRVEDGLRQGWGAGELFLGVVVAACCIGVSLSNSFPLMTLLT